MDIVTILRNLSRHRVLVSGALVLAILAGIVVTHKLPSFKSRQYQVGIATERILVDTPSSQVVNVAPRGIDTVGVTANLLATLMIDGPVKSAIAARAGVSPNEIIGSTSAATLAQTLTTAPSRTDYSLSTQVVTDPAGNALPIIEVDVQAPTGAGAAKLSAAVVAGVKDYLSSTAATERIPDADRIQVDSVGASPATTDSRGPSNLVGLAVAAGVFLFGCAAILGGGAFVRGWRAAEAREQVGKDKPIEPYMALTSDHTAVHPDPPVSADLVQSADDTGLAASQRPVSPRPQFGIRRWARSNPQQVDPVRPDSEKVTQQNPEGLNHNRHPGFQAHPATTSPGGRPDDRGAIALELAAHRRTASPRGIDAQGMRRRDSSAQSDQETDADAAAAAAGD